MPDEDTGAVQLPFDPVALAKQVTDASVAAAIKVAEQKASEAAASKLEQAAAVLTGRPQQVDHSEQVLKGFVADPVKFGQIVSNATEDRIMRKLQAQKSTEDQQRAVVMPFVEQYPELRSPTKLALIEKLTEKAEASGTSYSEALKSACEETIKEFGLKPVSEAQRQQAAFYAGLPGGGGMGSGAPARNEETLQTDFIAGMKNRALSFRNKVSTSKV